MEMKLHELASKLDFDFGDWHWGDGELDKLLGPYIAKLCAEAVQNSLTAGPPGLSLDNYGGGLTLYLALCFDEDASWECSFDDLILEAASQCDDEERRYIVSALRALADRVEAQTVKA